MRSCTSFIIIIIIIIVVAATVKSLEKKQQHLLMRDLTSLKTYLLTCFDLPALKHWSSDFSVKEPLTTTLCSFLGW